MHSCFFAYTKLVTPILQKPGLHAELVEFAATQGITKDGEGILGLSEIFLCKAALTSDCVVAAGTPWLRGTEAFKNRKGADYKIQKSFSTHPKIMRQLSPLTLVMQIAALQQKVCKRLNLASSVLKSCWPLWHMLATVGDLRVQGTQ